MTIALHPCQLKPEMERYEWVVIRHPELASSIKAQEPLELASTDGQNMENNGLKQPEKPAGDISPFLSARHFNLNSKNTSMFMAGSVDSIIVGEWAVGARPTQRLFTNDLCKMCAFVGFQGEVKVTPSTSTLSSTMAALAGAPPLTTRHFALRPSRLGC